MAAGKVRLREPAAGPNGAGPAAGAVPLRPLRVAGVVVAKAEVVEALKLYVPGLADLSVTEDGEHFWLMLGEEAERGDQAPG